MNRKKQEKILDELWGAVVKAKYYHHCQKNDCSEDYESNGYHGIIDSHHIVKRSHKRLRWYVSNGIALCRYRCHRHAEDYEREFLAWMEDREPERMEELYKLKRMGVKRYNLGELEEIERDLKEQLKHIGEENLPF